MTEHHRDRLRRRTRNAPHSHEPTPGRVRKLSIEERGKVHAWATSDPEVTPLAMVDELDRERKRLGIFAAVSIDTVRMMMSRRARYRMQSAESSLGREGRRREGQGEGRG